MIVKMNTRNGSLRKLNFGNRQNRVAASRRHACKEQVNRNKASCLENSISISVEMLYVIYLWLMQLITLNGLSSLITPEYLSFSWIITQYYLDKYLGKRILKRVRSIIARAIFGDVIKTRVRRISERRNENVSEQPQEIKDPHRELQARRHNIKAKVLKSRYNRKHFNSEDRTKRNYIKIQKDSRNAAKSYCSRNTKDTKFRYPTSVNLQKSKKLLDSPEINLGYPCQPIMQEEQEIHQHFMTAIEPLYTHNSVKEMMRAQDPNTLINDKKGAPIFPMGLMYTKDKEVVPYVYDSGASLTSILLGTDGIAFPTAPVDPGEQEWQRVRGIGGVTGVRMVYILVPLVDGSLTKIKAQIVENTLQCQTKNLRNLAAKLTREAIADGAMSESEEIQYPEYGSKAALMLGRSHQHLAPKAVYIAENGLTLYAGCIDGPRREYGDKQNQRTLCIGGSLLDEDCEEKFANLWMTIKQPDVIKNVIVEGSQVRSGEWGYHWQDLALTLNEEAMQIFAKQPDIINTIVHGGNRILGSSSQLARNVSELILEAEDYSLSGGGYPNSVVKKMRRDVEENQNFLLQHGLEERYRCQIVVIYIYIYLWHDNHHCKA